MLAYPGWEQAGELLDRAMLVYRLGAVSAFRSAQHQALQHEGSLAQVPLRL